MLKKLQNNASPCRNNVIVRSRASCFDTTPYVIQSHLVEFNEIFHSTVNSPRLVSFRNGWIFLLYCKYKSNGDPGYVL
uniref:Uncharacterized protein n=1 Tax=Megaselia scalaris TaxID=36166 RepID=T1GXP0_MEGSC